MANLTVDVNWEIEPPRSTPGVSANRFDQWRQSDQPIGPEPESHEMGGPPETNAG